LQQQAAVKTTNDGEANDEFDVKKYVANYLNLRGNRVVQGEFVKSPNANYVDAVAIWTFDALKSLKQQLQHELSNQSQYCRLRIFFELIPEFNRNMKVVTDTLSTVELVQDSQHRQLQQNLVVEWSTNWNNNNELETVSIKTRNGEPVAFLNKIVIRRDLIPPAR
jgi:hypothetical protein